MPASMTLFPMSAVVDGVLSYLQKIFGDPDITPSEYRFDRDGRISKIRVSGPFVANNDKPMSAPFVVVERSGFSINNLTIDNLRSADENTFENPSHTHILEGSITITCGSSIASEASNLANFIAIMLQADRNIIKSVLKFVRKFDTVSIGPETPVVKDNEIRRFEVVLQCSVSIQQGWVKRMTNLTQFNHADIKDTFPHDTSIAGVITAGSDHLVDSTQNFGVLLENSPQLLPKELAKGWYYIRFDGSNQLHTVVEIVDNHTLKLKSKDANNVFAPWNPLVNKSNVKYSLLWNNVNLSVEIGKP